MQRIWSVELPAHVGKRVMLAGWLHRVRRLSGVSFLILRDGQVAEDSALSTASNSLLTEAL